MPVYLLVGPAAALIGIVAILFVLRHRSEQTRSMYSSRRSQIERKVKAARQRTLAPSGRSGNAPTAGEIAATAVAAPPMPGVYEPPSAPRQQAWEAPAAPPPPPPGPPPAFEAMPPSPVGFEPVTPPGMPVEPAAGVGAQPEWTPAPADPLWTPTPAAPPDFAPAPADPYTPAPAARQAPAPYAPSEPASEPSTGGASWSIVGEGKAAEEGAPAESKGHRAGAGATGGSWEITSGEPGHGEDGEEQQKPSPAVAIAQYAVLVVGLVMVLIGVLVMVANSKVT